MIGDRDPDGGGPRFFGVYPAIVTSLTKDDKRLGRIEVSFPFLGEAGKDVRALATLCTPYADNDQGFEMIPSKGSQVLVAFEAGDLQRPYVLGACWNGREKLPQTPQAANDKRLIKTRSGSLLEFDDKAGSAKVTLSMKSGHRIVLDDSGPTLTIRHSGGSSITFEASGNVSITCKGALNITATSVMVKAPSTTHTGSITCLALTATSITSPLYSPGAGNIW
jgi:uncharacterized protein involved in type VI secretion and phage assembly